MPWVLAAIVTGIITFVVTNIDDLVLLTLFFSQTNAVFRRRHVVLGQYLGFAGIVLISLVGFVGSLWIPQAWIGLLGLLPIAIALNQIFNPEDDNEAPEAKVVNPDPPKRSWLSALWSRHTYTVAAVTFANGGDNFGVYIPLFASINLAQLVVVLATYAVLPAIECYVALYISRHPTVGRVMDRYSHRIVPLVLICLGVYILVENNTLSLVTGQL
ncbi:cadmium resistance transporter [Pseudanabaena sp. FACHB-2040]|uniref:cadmium resistance transporter n=1 Tax=Pseudanabaena sp. FACHB-2040 TaxID=2692859 RepID=UPI0016898780|nr:cadmium resistance transporter [Pseudanabaena sp. FACHB-2040]MBD2258505.1 cadmium resistance transporter [Pseudanabaena sp. FACHB-2040]